MNDHVPDGQPLTAAYSPKLTAAASLQTMSGASPDVNLYSIYVPTNHVYVGDVFLLEEKDIIHTNLSVREGLEIVVSVGMAVPPTLHATRM